MMNYSTMMIPRHEYTKHHGYSIQQQVDIMRLIKRSCETRSSTGIEVGCANTGVMHQKGEGKLPFNNVPEGTDAVNLFHKMHSPLLSGGTLSRKGNAH